MIRNRPLTWRIGAQCARQRLSTIAGVADSVRAMKVGESEDNHGEGRWGSDCTQDPFPLPGVSVVGDVDA